MADLYHPKSIHHHFEIPYLAMPPKQWWPPDRQPIQQPLAASGTRLHGQIFDRRSHRIVDDSPEENVFLIVSSWIDTIRKENNE